MIKKFPSLSQWKQIFKVLSKRERKVFLAFAVLAAISLVFLTASFYYAHTEAIPAYGGTYVEGVVGQPRFINPIYGETNETDRTLIDLVFSGLMAYDKDGKLTEDLAERYEISRDGKTYTFTLRDDAMWHDGKPVTADDVLFTVKTIQNSDYKSTLRANWIDVDTNKISDRTVTFQLKAPFNAFLETCTLKIIPKHIWESILPENFSLSYYNLQPVGSGPYAFSALKQADTGFIKQLELESNKRYHRGPAFIQTISFKFFEQKDGLIKAANRRAVDGFTLAGLENNQAAAEREIRQRWLGNSAFNVHYFSLPRYFAVFFNTAPNQKVPLFADSNIRKAMAHAVNKGELMAKMRSETKNRIEPVSGPAIPDFFGKPEPKAVLAFDLEKSKILLDAIGFKEYASGIRAKAIGKKPSPLKSYLKRGSKGAEVSRVQDCLTGLDDAFKAILENESPGAYGQATEDAVTEFQKKYLPALKPTGETGESTRRQLNALCAPKAPSQPLAFILTTISQTQMLRIAELLKVYWQATGAQVEINAVPVTALKQAIKARSYDALLYGEALGAKPDLYPFWHSSQKDDPGLNLSSYENKTADQLLKEARETTDESLKWQKYGKLQEVIAADAPAIFLYNPDHVYWARQKVKGIDAQKIIDPAKRFANIIKWHINTKRSWK